MLELAGAGHLGRAASRATAGTPASGPVQVAAARRALGALALRDRLSRSRRGQTAVALLTSAAREEVLAA